MANQLKSKPGLNGNTTLSIPKDWDSTWFRNFISNQLKGADVRNAIGTGGIKVSGTIASPYATIDGSAIVITPAGPSGAIQYNNGGVLGGTANLTYNGTTLTIVGADNTQILVLNDGAGSNGYYVAFENNSVLRGAIGTGPILGGGVALGDFAAQAVTGTLWLGTSGKPTAIGVTQAGDVTIATPISGTGFVVSPGLANTTAAQISGSATTGQSYGLTILAGTNASDAGFRVFNTSGSNQLFFVRGDGQTQLADRALSLFNAGYLEAPFRATSGAYTPVLADSGKTLDCSASTAITLPLNSSVAYPIGTIIAILADFGAGSMTVAAGAGDTLYLAGAIGTTGTRTIAPIGLATVLRLSTTQWVISGAGIT